MIDLLASLRDNLFDSPHLGWYLSLAWGSYMLLLSAWIVLQKREPAATLSWVMSLAALPFVGFAIYYVLGPRRIRRNRLRRLRSRAALGPVLPESLGDSGNRADLARLARATTELEPTTSLDVQLLVGGSRTFEVMLEAIASAQHHIHLEYYIFEPDDIGTRVRDALVERASAGVRVRVLLDAVGSAALSSRFLAPLLTAGAELEWFHPFRLRWIRKPRVNLRNHRKLLLIDGRVAFTGGINISDAEDESCRVDAYRDLHLRLQGNVVRALQVIFLEDWAYAAGVVLSDERLWPELEAGELPTLVLPSGPDSPWETLHRVQVDAITRAETRVWLTTPYFVPTEAARLAITSAALRGVDVRIIVPRRSDSLIVTLAAHSYFDELLAAGVRVFEYLPSMLHSKALLVDSELVLIGSANFDNRSFRLNFELCVLLRDATLASELMQVCEADMHQSREVRATDKRPALPVRLAEAVARLLSPLL